MTVIVIFIAIERKTIQQNTEKRTMYLYLLVVFIIISGNRNSISNNSNSEAAEKKKIEKHKRDT